LIRPRSSLTSAPARVSSAPMRFWLNSPKCSTAFKRNWPIWLQGVAHAAGVTSDQGALAPVEGREKLAHLAGHVQRGFALAARGHLGEEQHGVAFQLADLQREIGRADDGLEQLADDLFGVQQAGVVHARKARIPADICQDQDATFYFHGKI